MRKGKLRIFMGFAAGVGKTYQMLTEARRLRDEGHDVVIGYFEPHARKDTIAQTEGLEFVPRRVYEHRGASFEEMDTDAILARRPETVAVDEFAHTNVPGSAHLKRWQDVMTILEAGIDVLTSLNVQHLESLNDQVWHVTGIRVRETVPDWVVQGADEVVMVDITPRALLHRLERGVVYSPEKARLAVKNFFTEANLTALRELALRQAAHQLEMRVGPQDGPQEGEAKREAPAAGLQGQEKLLLWITPKPSTAMLIRRGKRVADYLGSRCSAVYSDADASSIGQWLNFCENLRIETRAISCTDPPLNVATYAREQGATQLFVTSDTPQLKKLVNHARDMQVIIVAERVRPEQG
jgi:two-component system sensor histidine kinase KdpD